MSEPYGAFVRLQIARPALVRWLDAPPPNPARWTDWRDIGGRWYLTGGVGDLEAATDADMAGYTGEARAVLAQCASTRDAFRGLIRESDTAGTRHISYDPAARGFVAGTLFYDENLVALLAFLALTRGSEDFLGPDEAGVVVIHDYVFASDGEGVTVAALALGLGQSSHVLAKDERASAVGAFQGIADAMLSHPDKPPVPVDQLDDLR